MSDDPKMWARWLQEMEEEEEGMSVVFDGNVDVVAAEEVIVENLKNDGNVDVVTAEEVIVENLKNDVTPKRNRSVPQSKRLVIDNDESSSSESYENSDKAWTPQPSSDDDSIIASNSNTRKKRRVSNGPTSNVLKQEQIKSKGSMKQKRTKSKGSIKKRSTPNETSSTITISNSPEKNLDVNTGPTSNVSNQKPTKSKGSRKKQSTPIKTSATITITDSPEKNHDINTGSSLNETFRTPTKLNTSRSREQSTSDKTLTPSRSDNDSNASIVADTPPKKRSRFSNPNSWARTVRKNNRVAGLQYTTPHGEIRPAKTLVPIVEDPCRFKCANYIDAEQQQSLFDNYMQYNDVTRRKDYLCTLVTEVPVQRKRKRNENSDVDRAISREHYLPDKDGKRIRVCQKFFCNVFGISKAFITSALQNRSPHGSYVGRDRRVGRPASNATPDHLVKKVERFLSEIPKIPSHYCRARSNRLYLAPDLNVSKLYKMYCSKHGDNDGTVTYAVFRNIFNQQDPPLSVFTPKKDQCVTCNNAEREGTAGSEVHTAHIERKNAIKEMKAQDKKKAEKSKTMIYATFDLQAVLTLPYAADSQLYYKRKLTTYNFTVYDNRKEGFCFTWDETEGKKGSAEIGSCVIKYIEALPTNIETIVFYCDTCGGQNRNQNVMAGLLYAVNKFPNLRTIDLKFMESGHSYLEADSMHGAIERCRKGKTFYLPHDYRLLMKMARKEPFPYKVTELKHRDFFDLQLLAKDAVTNRNKTTSNQTLRWLNVKWFRFTKNSNIVGFKYDVKKDFEYITVHDEDLNWSDVELVQKYNCGFPISIKKKKDLLSLIKSGVIPTAYSAYYHDLPSSTAAKDEPAWDRNYNPDKDYVAAAEDD